MTINYNKTFVDMNNLKPEKNRSSIFATEERLFRYDNIQLFRKSFTEKSEPSTVYLNYISVKKSILELEDSIFGFYRNPKEIEYQEAHLESDASLWQDEYPTAYRLYFEVDTVGHRISRSVWNLEDDLGRIGGVMSIIAIISQFVMSILSANNVTIYMASET